MAQSDIGAWLARQGPGGLTGLPMSPVGGGLPMSPVGAPADPPKELSKFQAFMQRVKNDPDLSRAFQVAGLSLLGSSREEGTIPSFARAGLTGLQTLEQRRAQRGAAEAAAEDRDFKRGQEERRTKAQERKVEVAAEKARRDIILKLADLKSSDQARKQQADIDLRKLALEQEKARAERLKEGKETQADRDLNRWIQVVEERAAENGVELTPSEKFVFAVEMQNEAKEKVSSGVNKSQVFGQVMGSKIDNADPDADMNQLIDESVGITEAAAGKLTPPRPEIGASLDKKLERLKQKQPLNQGQGPTKAAAGGQELQSFTDGDGNKFTIVAETDLDYTLQFQTPDGRTGTVRKPKTVVDSFR